MSSTSYQSKPSQHFSSVNRFALDNEFELLFEYHPGQGTVGPFVPVQDDSPSEEVAPVKRKITKRHQQSKKTESHSNEPWSPQEEIALWYETDNHQKDKNKAGNGQNLSSDGKGEDCQLGNHKAERGLVERGEMVYPWCCRSYRVKERGETREVFLGFGWRENLFERLQGKGLGMGQDCGRWRNEAWIFESKREWGDEGSQGEDLRNKKNTSLGIGVSTDSDDTINDGTLVGVASAVQEGVTPSGVDMTVEMGKQNSLDDTTVPESFPPLSTPITTMAGNAPGKSSFANITGKTSGKKVNVRTLFTPGGNGIDVVVLVDSIRAISERLANTAYGFFLGEEGGISCYGLDAMLENGPWFIRNNPLILKKWHPDENLLKEDVSTVPVWVKLHGVPVTAFGKDGLSAITTKLGTPLMLDSYTSDMCMQSWGRSSYARVMIELRADVELKDNIVVAMPKITKEGPYICNVRVEYEWKPPRCSSCKIFGHIHEECPKNTGASEKKNVKKPSQTSRGVEPTIEVSNSKLFDVLNSVDNDVKFGTNGGTTNLVNNEATSSGSSFMNIDNDGEFASNTPIGEKIDKIERQICEGKLRLLDNDGNPLVPTGIVESDSEVEVVFDETANLRISTSGKDESDKDYGTNSLLKQ
ncbi:cytokinin dehydrogenase 3-like protein [Tanacetum coccineum]